MARSPKKKPTKVRPPVLTREARIALVAPAFGFDSKLLDQGRESLEAKYGVKTLELGSLRETHAYLAGTDQRRCDELYHWLTSTDANALLAVRGGYGCSRIYPELIARLRKHRRLAPKAVIGYSDLTIVLNGLYQDLGWTTFHGPVLVGRPFRAPLPIEERTFRDALFSKNPLGPITDEQMIVVHPGKASGPIVGGCLSLVVSSLGTSYELDTRGKVLFLEEVDEKPYRLDRMLTQLLHAGKLDKIKALVFGQMVHCEPGPDSRDPNKTSALEAVKLTVGPHLKKRDIPAVYNFPAGHGSPQITFPIGAKVEVHANPRAPKVVFVEAGVK